MGIIPNSKPQASRADIEALLKLHGVDLDKTGFALVGVRGYYLDTMGVKGKNDRGIHDDAFFWISKDKFLSFNGNVDPTRFRKGRGTGSGKGMASLKKGLWWYLKGMHNGSKPHMAFRQAAPVTVIRDGIDGDYEDTGWFGINIHCAGRGTSSLGCQTVPPVQWNAFREVGYGLLKECKKEKFPYLLVDELDRIALAKKVPTKVPVQESQQIDLSPAIENIKKWEGFFTKAYQDTGGVWTIGWGTIRYINGVKVKKGDTITRDQAEKELMHEIMIDCLPKILDFVNVPLTNNELCALVSFVYNIGYPAFKSSTLLKKLNACKHLVDIASEFHRWNKDNGKVIKGLVNRRIDEANLFLKPDADRMIAA